MGIDATVTAMSDKKVASQRWITRYWGAGSAHMFSSNSAVMDGTGYCCMHKQECKVGSGVDIALAGLPCQAYSKRRAVKRDIAGFARSGQASRSGLAHQHPGHSVVQEFVEYLGVCRPAGFIVEETDTFLGPDQDGTDHAIQFMTSCAQVGPGYAVTWVVGDHSDWCNMARKRRLRLHDGRHHDLGCMLLFSLDPWVSVLTGARIHIFVCVKHFDQATVL